MATSEIKSQGWRPSKGRPATYSPQPWPPFCSAATQTARQR